MLRSKGFYAAVIVFALASALFLTKALGQDQPGDKAGGRGGKQKGNQGPPAPTPAILRNYQSVTAERLT